MGLVMYSCWVSLCRLRWLCLSLENNISLNRKMRENAQSLLVQHPLKELHHHPMMSCSGVERSLPYYCALQRVISKIHHLLEEAWVSSRLLLEFVSVETNTTFLIIISVTYFSVTVCFFSVCVRLLIVSCNYSSSLTQFVTDCIFSLQPDFVLTTK